MAQNGLKWELFQSMSNPLYDWYVQIPVAIQNLRNLINYSNFITTKGVLQ